MMTRLLSDNKVSSMVIGGATATAIESSITSDGSMPSLSLAHLHPNGEVTNETNTDFFQISGYNGPSTPSDVNYYNPSTNTWTSKAALTTPKFDVNFARVGNKLYGVGGRNYAGTNFRKMMIYNIDTNTWSEGTDYYTDLGKIGIVAVRTDIYTIGGEISSSGDCYGKCYKYNTLTNAYSALADALEVVAGCGVVYYNGAIYIFGGTKAYDSFVKAIRKYTIATNSWETLATTVPTSYVKTAAYYDNVHMSIGWNQHARYNITSQTLTTGLGAHSQYAPFVAITGNKLYFCTGGNTSAGSSASITKNCYRDLITATVT